MPDLTPDEEQRRHERQLASDRAKLDRELHDEQIKHGRRTARMALVGTILAAILAGAATIYANKVGSKVNPQVNVFQRVSLGYSALFRLGDTQVPITQIFPAVAPQPAQVPSPNSPANTSVPLTPSPALTPDALSTDPAVLEDCSVSSPIKIQRVRVDTTKTGYEVTFKVLNTGQSPVSLWSDGDRRMNDDAGANSTSGTTNLPIARFDTFSDNNIAKSFTAGITIKPGESDIFDFRFDNGGVPAGRTITFGAELSYILQGAAGSYTRQRTTLSCQRLPVMTLEPSH